MEPTARNFRTSQADIDAWLPLLSRLGADLQTLNHEVHEDHETHN